MQVDAQTIKTTDVCTQFGAGGLAIEVRSKIDKVWSRGFKVGR